MTTILKSLSLLNVSDKEQYIFEALLELGLASVNELAQAANFQRSTTYIYLESLKKKGLVLETVKNNKKYFKAIEVQNLRTLVKNRISDLKKLEKNLSKIEIKKGKNNNSPDFLIYHGLSGLFSILDQTIESKQEVYFLGSNKYLETLLNREEWDKIYHSPRRRKEVAEYLITDQSKGVVQRFLQESGTFTKIRFLPPEVDYNGAIVAFGNKLLIAKYSPEPVVIAFEDQTLVELFKLAYMSLWKELEGKNIPGQKTGNPQ